MAKKTKQGRDVMAADENKRTSALCSINFVKKIDVEKFYEFETPGVQAVNCSCPKSALSIDDKRGMELIEHDRYVIGLPLSTILERDRYVNDLIHSCLNTDEAVKSMEEVDTVLSTGSFNIKELICSSTVEKTSKSELTKETSIAMSEPQPATSFVNLDGK